LASLRLLGVVGVRESLRRTSPTWKRCLNAHRLSLSAALAGGTAHPLAPPTSYTSGARDAAADEAPKRTTPQEAAKTTATRGTPFAMRCRSTRARGRGRPPNSIDPRKY
jgi:hypothetical protein